MLMWHGHLQLYIQLKSENLRTFKFFTIEMLTCGKLQVEQMAPCGLPRLTI
jgi:hypothetical protein